MKFLTILMLSFISLTAQAQLTVSPVPVSGGIALAQANTYIYITNPSAVSVSPNITLGSNSAGVTATTSRCATLRARSTCYIIVNFPSYATNSQVLSIPLSSGALVLANLTFAPVVQPSSSIFVTPSVSMDGFSNYSITIQNKTPSAKTYAPVIGGVDASKYSIVLNKCSSVSPGGTCLVYLKLAPQEVGSYSASVTESQVTGSATLSSTITLATAGVILPPNPSITMTPASSSFGTITNLGKTASKLFTITNNGNVAVSPIIAVAGTGLEIVLNRCLLLLSPNQSCSVSVLFNAVGSMTNGTQSGLSISAQATALTSLLTSTLSATLNVSPVLLGSVGGSSGGSPLGALSTFVLQNSYQGTTYLYNPINLTLYSWGANFNGQLGNGSSINSSDSAIGPYSLNSGNSYALSGKYIKDFTMGVYGYHACAITTGEQIYCWGYNYAGQSAVDSSISSSVEAPALLSLTSPAGFKKLALASFASFVLTNDGKVYCWGANSSGSACADPNITQGGHIPVALDMTGVLAGKTIKDISAGYTTGCVVASDDRVYCWGSNYGSFGDGNLVSESYVPVAVDWTGALAGKTTKSLHMTDYGQTCIIASDDKPYCWGANYYGQVGSGITDSTIYVPTQVDMTGVLAGKTVKSMKMGDSNVCVIASDDKPYCWGSGSSGQLGDGTIDVIGYSPVAVDMSGALAGKTVKKITLHSSGQTICVIASDDKPYCWGNNNAGQLGNGTTNNSSVPVAVDHSGLLAGKTVQEISTNGSSVCVVASDNKTYCIGQNYYGQLGDGTANVSSVFVLAPTIP